MEKNRYSDLNLRILHGENFSGDQQYFSSQKSLEQVKKSTLSKIYLIENGRDVFNDADLCGIFNFVALNTVHSIQFSFIV